MSVPALTPEQIARVHRSRPVPLQATADADGITLSGYALRSGEMTEGTGWVSGPVLVADNPPLWLNRRPSHMLALCALDRDEEGLFATARISDLADVAGAYEVESCIRRGRQLHFSAEIVADDPDPRRASWQLVAVSLLTMHSEIQAVRPDHGPLRVSTKAELTDALRAAGFARVAAERIAAGGWPALDGATNPSASSIAQTIEATIQKLKEASP